MASTINQTIRRLSGYTWVPRDFDSLELTHYFVAVEEEKPEQISGIFVPKPDSVVIGRVLKVGARAEEMGIHVGDRIIYEQWQGGRWQMGERNFLIMDANYISSKLEE